MCIFWKKKKQPVNEYVNQKDLSQMNERGSIMKPEIYVVEEVELDEIEIEEIEVADEIKEESKQKIQKYHVSQNKNKDAENYMKWRVRKESSDKTIQYFDTQKLAIDYAQGLATKFGTKIVIHKLDGSIRKQDYSNKE